MYVYNLHIHIKKLYKYFNEIGLSDCISIIATLSIILYTLIIFHFFIYIA